MQDLKFNQFSKCDDELQLFIENIIQVSRCRRSLDH